MRNTHFCRKTCELPKDVLHILPTNQLTKNTNLCRTLALCRKTCELPKDVLHILPTNQLTKNTNLCRPESCHKMCCSHDVLVKHPTQPADRRTLTLCR
ncbi:hypothetical protein CesoFtcFv8_016247 [Champsocephalus esox]|uniref:Uncharacterized protein n=1 Tax=Champsocephalus esox TaxID=159716 RepID=A0AAN8GQ35_9TELE|nr:hypothetical protein CesoFtcFv8_016247 [Champsocephalus esox]